MVLGHEICGELVESSNFSISRSYPDEDVCKLDLVEGTRVVSFAVMCLTCMYCDTGQYNLCTNLGEIGSSIDGGFAEFMHIPNNTLRIGGRPTPKISYQ